ncbi:MAG TPA: hypothetical protein DCS21_12545 [Gammaproteobacteria bacterium]|nr:hypothetical protein [Gammaproteobacteria bacterium]
MHLNGTSLRSTPQEPSKNQFSKEILIEINNQSKNNEFEILPIETRHTSLLTCLPAHHKDPFDRLLVAQALVERVAIVSVDLILDDYGVTRLW